MAHSIRFKLTLVITMLLMLVVLVGILRTRSALDAKNTEQGADTSGISDVGISDHAGITPRSATRASHGSAAGATAARDIVPNPASAVKATHVPVDANGLGVQVDNLGDIRRDSLALSIQMPTKRTTLDKAIRFNDKGFGQSKDRVANSLLSRHNVMLMRASKVELAGVCEWRMGGPGGERRPFAMIIDREHLRVTLSCGPNVSHITEGVVQFSGDLEKDCLDTYYLMGVGVFDPKIFSSSEADTIALRTDSGEQEKIDVVRVTSPEQDLYFDSNKHLVRIDLRSRSHTYSSVYLQEYTNIEGVPLPMLITVTFPDPTHFADNPSVPQAAILRIDAKRVKVYLKGEK